MKSAAFAFAAVSLCLASCAPTAGKGKSGASDDSRKVSRSSIKSYTDVRSKPPGRILFNEHPSASIMVTYEVTEPGEQPKRETREIKAFKEIRIGSMKSTEKIITTDFTDAWQRGE